MKEMKEATVLSRRLKYLLRILQTSQTAPMLKWSDGAGCVLGLRPTRLLGGGNQRTSHQSRGPGHASTALSWSEQFHTPTSNSRSEGERRTQPDICPHFSLKCANTVTPRVILSGVVRIRSLFSFLQQTHHQNTTSVGDGVGWGWGWGGGGDGGEDGARWRGGKAMETEQMFVWLLICSLIRELHRQLELMAC